MSPRAAGLVDNGISMASTLGGTAVIRASQLASFPNFRLPFNSGTKFNGELIKPTSSHKITELEAKISGWLGNGTRSIKNEAGDPVFLSKDGV